MANYINTLDNTYPHSETQIRAANPQTSFPAQFRPPEGFEIVFPAPAPAHDPITQYVREVAPVLTVKGHYEQAYEIVDRFSDYTDEDGVSHTKVEQETAAIAAGIEAKRVAAIPATISPRQLRQALTAAGLRSAVETAIAAADQDTKDWYEFATEVERSHPMVNAMAQGLGVSTRQLDDLFTLAGGL